ncbi:MAG: ABC transporter permease [Deltaproteobacteria bacterium]|nr:ABC transporter permease [Deltaproteobacteria bacterium]
MMKRQRVTAQESFGCVMVEWWLTESRPEPMIQWLGVRNLTVRLWRTTSTVLGIGAGASLFLTVVLINQSVLQSYRESLEALTGRAELVVTPDASSWMPEELLSKIEQVPGIAHATPSVQTMAKITWADGNFARNGAKASLITGDSLEFLNSTSHILLARSFAARNGLKVGDTVTASTPTGAKSLTIRGLLPEGGMAKAFGGALAVMDIDAARKTFAFDGQTSRVDLFLKAGTSPRQAQARVSTLLGASFRVEEPAERVDNFQNSFRSFQALIEFLAAVGLFVAWVLVAGTIHVSVTERQGELGILRAIGASPMQILTMILGESFWLGLLGGGLALAASFVFSHAMLGTVVAALSAQALLKIPEPQLHLPLVQAFEFLLLTATGAAIAGLFPAWRATRVSLLASIEREQPHAAAEAPWATLAAPVPSLIAQMAIQNVVRRPSRTSTTVGLLATALAFVAVIEVMTGSFEKTLSARFDHTLTPELVIFGQGKGRPDQRQTLHEGFVDELRGLPGVRGAYGRRLLPIRYEGREISLISLDDMGVETGYRVLDVVDRPREQAGIELYSSPDFTVLVSESFRNHFHKSTGDFLWLAAPMGNVRARVIGITTDFSSPNGALYTSRAWYRKIWKDPLLNGIGIMVQEGHGTTALQTTLRSRYALSRNVVVLSDREYRNEVQGIAAQAIVYVKSLRWAALFIALIALFNSFMVDIRERWQELGLLRAVGMSPLQMMAMLVFEALLKAAMAVILGLGLGLGVAWFGLTNFLTTRLGWVFHLHFSWQAPALCAALAGIVSILAVAIPAFKAVSLEVSLALAEL